MRLRFRFNRRDRSLSTVLEGADALQTTAQRDEQAAQLAAMDASHAVLTCAMDGTITAANPRFLAAMGATEAELLGEHHSILIALHRRSSAKYLETWATLRRGEIVSGEFPHTTKTGATVWLAGAYTPVLDRLGHPVSVIAITMDITAAKQKSIEDAGQVAAMRKSQAIAIYSPSGTVLSANENFLRIMGYTEAEIVGHHHRLFMDPVDAADPSYHEFWLQLASGKHQTAEYRRRAKNGNDIWFQASYTPVFDQNNDLVQIVKYATDITEEMQRRKQIKLLSLLADKSDISVSICDAESRIIYVNRGYERLTGYSLADVLGTRPGERANGPGTDKTVYARIVADLASRKPFHEEILVYTKQGRPFWINVTTNPVFNEAGELIYFVAAHTDITVTKQDALAYNAKLLAIGESSAMAEWTAAGEPISANAFLCGEHAFGLALGSLLSAKAIGRLLDTRHYRQELEISRYGKPPLWVDASFSVLVDLEGRPYRILMCGADVTARRQTVAASIASMTQMVTRITGILQAISRFANQTNLLALNAGIEAARAERGGSEFGLIAQEIRRLSVEASTAIKEIEALLRESQIQITSMSAPNSDTRPGVF